MGVAEIGVHPTNCPFWYWSWWLTSGFNDSLLSDKDRGPVSNWFITPCAAQKKKIRLASGQPWTRRGPEMPSSSLHGLQMGVLKTGDPKVTMVISSLEWSMTWMIWGILGAPPWLGKASDFKVWASVLTGGGDAMPYLPEAVPSVHPILVHNSCLGVKMLVEAPSACGTGDQGWKKEPRKQGTPNLLAYEIGITCLS